MIWFWIYSYQNLFEHIYLFIYNIYLFKYKYSHVSYLFEHIYFGFFYRK